MLILWGGLVTCRRWQIGLLNIPIKFSNKPINIGRRYQPAPHVPIAAKPHCAALNVPDLAAGRR
jgi:hypothetical protein